MKHEIVEFTPLPEPEIMPSVQTVGDTLIKGLWLLGRAIYHLQHDHAGPNKTWSEGEVNNYFDALYVIQPRFVTLQEQLNWAMFSPWHELNRKGNVNTG